LRMISLDEYKNLNNSLSKNVAVKLEILKEMAKEDLRQAVQTNLYDFRKKEELVMYDRTNQLIDSITASDVVVKNIGSTAEIEFSVYFDSDKMHHKSVVSGTEYYNGEKINVSFLTDEGHHNPNGNIPEFDQYEGREFVESAMKQIMEDLNQVIRDAILIEVKRFGKYR